MSAFLTVGSFRKNFYFLFLPTTSRTVGAIISDIPLVDRIDIAAIRTGQRVTVDGERVHVE